MVSNGKLVKNCISQLAAVRAGLASTHHSISRVEKVIV